MIPPGLAYLSVSERAWAAMEKSTNPRYYFDLRKERKNAVKGESAYTPAVALVAGLGAALDYIAGQAGGDLEKGRIALVNNAEVNAAATRAGLVALGFTLFAPKAPAAAATAVAVPEGMVSGDVVKALKLEFAWSPPTDRARCKARSSVWRISATSTISIRLRSWEPQSTSQRTRWGCRSHSAKRLRPRKKCTQKLQSKGGASGACACHRSE